MKRNIKVNIYCDGGARGNPGPAAAAYVVFKDKKIIRKDSKFLGEKTNNFSEHMAVCLALTWLIKNFKLLSISTASFFLDSQLVVNQLNGKYKIKSSNLKPLVVKSKKLEKKFIGIISYKHIPREENKIADSLVNNKIDEKT